MLPNIQNNRNEYWLRVNGSAHAFLNELGCSCNRCTTRIYPKEAPSGILEKSEGWLDPPNRANTSASIFISNAERVIQKHILFDLGAGVVDSLVNSNLQNLDKVAGVTLSHWHPDHTLGLNRFGESIKRKNKANFTKIPLYCTLDTFEKLHSNGQSYTLNRFFNFQKILPGNSFTITPFIEIIPISVAHGKIKGAVVQVLKILSKKIIFLWDIDIPQAKIPNTLLTNQKMLEKFSKELLEPDVLFLSANTWHAEGTGHCSFNSAISYLELIRPKMTYLVHYSGHEDTHFGFGLSDSELDSHLIEWTQNNSGKFHARLARQGMILKL